MITYLLYVRKKKRIRWINRRWRTRPFNLTRDIHGDYNTLFQDIKNDSEVFYRYTRMSKIHFEKLLSMIEPFLKKKSSRALNPELRLLITLRYLATVSILQPMYLSPPEKGDWKKNTEGFWARWNMPNCLGSIDGKHIRIRCPPHSGSLCFNYKKYYSIVLLAIADHLYRFTLVDVGSYGGNSDGGIFNNSDISVHLNNKLNIPHGDINLPGSELKTSLFFIADDAFKLSKRIMKPFSYENLNYEKQIFNYRISRARRTVESAFGILANKWRILHTAICVLPQTADLMVYASICLHNFILKEEEHSGYKDFSNVCSASIEENSIWINTTPNFEEDNTAISGEMQRCILKDYFQSAAGEVEWQHEYVQRGTFRDNKE